ncbi:MAG: IS21-like element helper ATPase IstB [Candidatus Dormibacteraeota bacterium]|nr:IS21-like element helper ATPase IstB [Candidatus Dormibacteraeota bacterium]
MLISPTVDALHALNLGGMARALAEQRESPDYAALTFEERLGLLVDREAQDRGNRRLERNLKAAKLRTAACVEDIDFHRPRGLDRSVILGFATAQWVDAHQNLLIVGPTGAGKTFLACALAQAAVRSGHTALYMRAPRLLDDLALAHGDGRWARLMTAWARIDVLLIDDLVLRPLTADQAADLLEVIEDRSQRRSTIITSQLPVANWHEALGDPTLADAILDRLTHNAHRIELRGDSLRRARPQSDADEPDPPNRRTRPARTAAESASEAR